MKSKRLYRQCLLRLLYALLTYSSALLHLHLSQQWLLPVSLNDSSHRYCFHWVYRTLWLPAPFLLHTAVLFRLIPEYSGSSRSVSGYFLRYSGYCPQYPAWSVQPPLSKHLSHWQYSWHSVCLPKPHVPPLKCHGPSPSAFHAVPLNCLLYPF